VSLGVTFQDFSNVDCTQKPNQAKEDKTDTQQHAVITVKEKLFPRFTYFVTTRKNELYGNVKFGDD